MKCPIILLLAIAVDIAQLIPQDNFRETLSMWRKTVEPYMSECMCETRARRDMIENFFQNGELTSDACFKCNIKCYAQKLGVFSPSGNVNITLLRDVAFGVDETTVLKCAHLSHQDQCQKAYLILMCLYNSIRPPQPRLPPTPMQTYLPVTPSSNKFTLFNPLNQYFLDGGRNEKWNLDLS